MLPHPPTWADFFVGSGAFAFVLAWKPASVGLAPNAPHAEDSCVGAPCLTAQPEVVPGLPANGVAGFSAGSAEMTELPSLLGRGPAVFVLLVKTIQSAASGFSSVGKGLASAGAWLETGVLLSVSPTGAAGVSIDLLEAVGAGLEDEPAEPSCENEIGEAAVLGDSRGTEKGGPQAVALKADAIVGPGAKLKPCSVSGQCDMSWAGSSFQVSAIAIAATSEGWEAEAGIVGGEDACGSALSTFFFFFSSLPTAQKDEIPFGGEMLLDPGVHSSSSIAFGGRSSSVIGVGTGAETGAD